MRIALLDLNHMTRGVHNNTVPLSLGLIATYLRREVKCALDIKIFKNAQVALKVLKVWKPQIMGVAQYAWNSELNLWVSKIIKQVNPECLLIAGGPNLDSQSLKRAEFFQQYPWVDICIEYDGEIPFCEITKQVMAGVDRLTIKQFPVAGAYSFDLNKSKVINSAQKPPRLASLDIFGPVYADGVFDEFMDEGFHPFLQTHRGCPFTCAFCHASDKYYSRMLFLSPGIFRQDLEYLARRFSGQHDVILYLANTNMGLFEQDFSIAEIIREIQNKYNWPHIFNVNSGKDPAKLLKMLSIINFQPGIALQTLTPKVLENIARINIPFDKFVSFQRAVLSKTGQASSTELILSLPGETKETFLSTLKQVLNSGVQNVVIYTLMNLKGTTLSFSETIEKYGYKIKHRVVPRQFSGVNGKKIFDTEEVVVSTNTMSFEDYLYLRGLAFTITGFFSSAELVPLKRLLIEYNLDLADWVFSIHGSLDQFPKLKLLYEDFIQETKDELFESRQSLIDFFENEENFDALNRGEFGDNLLRKYKCLLLSEHFHDVLRLAIEQVKKPLSSCLGEESNELLEDMFKFLSTRDVSKILDGAEPVLQKNMHFSYDLPMWLSLGKGVLGDFYGSFEYSVHFDKNLHVEMKKIAQMNKDEELSLQILYRDGNIREFWPKLERV